MIEKALNTAGDFLIKEIGQAIDDQGHNLTGGTKKSLRKKVDKTVLEGFADFNIVFLDQGIKPSKIPFTIGGPRRGGRSDYIKGLIRFWRLRGLSPREAKKAAFATANVQKEEGMPTKLSERFSKTGDRTGVVTDTLVRTNAQVREIIFKGMGETVDLQIRNIVIGKPL